MSNVYLAVSLAPDRLLGRVEADGRVYRERFGPDEQIGRVDLSSGNVYRERFGPDEKVGRADLSDGSVYLSRLGPDERVGRVDSNGRLYVHKAVLADEYVGKVEDYLSYAHSAGALLLLVLPALDAGAAEDASEQRGESPQ